jgi:hypothetical protein
MRGPHTLASQRVQPPADRSCGGAGARDRRPSWRSTLEPRVVERINRSSSPSRRERRSESCRPAGATRHRRSRRPTRLRRRRASRSRCSTCGDEECIFAGFLETQRMPGRRPVYRVGRSDSRVTGTAAGANLAGMLAIPRRSASPHLAALAVAKRIRGKMGRHITSRATRSRHRAWGAASAAPAPPVCRLLQRGPTSHVAWSRRAGRARRPTAERWQGRRASARRWAPPPLLEGCVTAERVFGQHRRCHCESPPIHARPSFRTGRGRAASVDCSPNRCTIRLG